MARLHRRDVVVQVFRPGDGTNGYVEDSLPVANFGTSYGYPMSKLPASLVS